MYSEDAKAGLKAGFLFMVENEGPYAFHCTEGKDRAGYFAMVLEALGIPVAYIGLIVAVDRIFDMGRTCLNVTGDIACSVCVTKWEGKKE